MKRALLLVLLLLVAIPVAAILFADAILNTESVRTRLEAAATRAAGHPVQLAGPLGLSLSPEPRIFAERVTVLNPPGFSRPALATLRRVEAQTELMPLLGGQVRLRAVRLEGADVLLERDASGRGNWLRPPPPSVSDTAPPPSPSAPRSAVAVQRVSLSDSRIAWLGGPDLSIQRLNLDPGGGPAEGELLLDGLRFTVAGTTAPAEAGRLHLDLTATGPGLAAAISGEAGGTLAVQLRASDLSALAPLLKRDLPRLRDVQLSFALPGPAALRLTAGPSPLDAVAPGLALQQLLVEAPTPSEPLRLAAVATLRQLPLALVVTAGSLDALTRPGSTPLLARLDANTAVLTAQGTMDPRAGAAELTIGARVPDLARTGALAGQSWPPLRDLAVDGRLAPRPGGGGGVLRGLRITAAGGDLAGDLAFALAPRPSLRGSLVAQRLDLDTLLASTPQPVPQPAPQPAPAPPAAPAQPAPPHPLPFAALLQADADLRLAVGQATLNGVPYRAIEARLLLADGRLRLDPATLTAPGGSVQAQLGVDAAATPPTAALTLRAPAMDAAPLASLLGAPGAASGTVDVDAQLRGAGTDWPAMLRTLDGHLSAAVTDGEIENAAIATLLSPVLRAVNLPPDLAGRSHLRCLVIRGTAAAGQVAVRTMALDTTKLRLEGEGSMNLLDQTMDLHLRPTVRLGPTTLAVPVRLAGPIRRPTPAADRGVIAPGRFGIAIGGAAPDPCPAALAAMRAP